MKELFVWILTGQPRLIGKLASYRGDDISFTYEDSWIQEGFSLSGDMPLSPNPVFHTRNHHLGAISDALPDNFGEAMIKLLHSSSQLTTLSRLYYVGDDRFGALGFSDRRDVYHPYLNRALQSFNDVEEVCNLLDELGGSMDEHIKRLISSTKSMGGAHPKGLLQHEGESWIVKFPYGSNTDTPLIEHACMTLAGKAGIRVAETFTIPLSVGNAVAIKRFDRASGSGDRYHVLSANTVLKRGFDEQGTLCNQELSYGALADVVRHTGSNQEDRLEVFKRMVFNILMDNTDDHEKNHSFILTEDGWRLSPAYDILPLASSVGSQQLMVGDYGHEGSYRNAMSQCLRFALDEAAADRVWHEVASVVSEWKPHFKECGVTSSDITYLSEFVDSESKLLMRKGFGDTAINQGANVEGASDFDM